MKRKKYPVLLAEFECFCGKKRIFGPLSAFRQNGRFSVIPARTRSVVNVDHFFIDPDDPTKFCWPWSKIKGTYNSDWGLAQNGPNPGWAPENELYLGSKKKFLVAYALSTKSRDSKTKNWLMVPEKKKKKLGSNCTFSSIAAHWSLAGQTCV